MKKINYVLIITIINIILIIIAILNIIFVLFFSTGGYSIKVNSTNEEIVRNALTGEIDDVDNVKKIVLGQGFQSGTLTVYHSSGKTDTLYSQETLRFAELEEYMRENGYNVDRRDYYILESSGIIFLYIIIISIIYMTKKTNRKMI